MRTRQGRCTAARVLSLIAVALASCEALTGGPVEKGVGPPWTVLFDGTDASAWRGFRSDSLPEGWRVVDGTLARLGPGGDIVTRATFSDFELELEWRISPGGNSGIFFRIDEQHDHVWQTGPEMQVLDDAGHADGKNPLTAAGANYALHSCAVPAVRPVGEWNRVRMIVRGPHVEHWLNDELVVSYELWNSDWQGLVAASKFASMPDYGRNRAGHIALQDHGDAVWFRDIRVRQL